jgi:hypothetical protein
VNTNDEAVDRYEITVLDELNELGVHVNNEGDLQREELRPRQHHKYAITTALLHNL